MAAIIKNILMLTFEILSCLYCSSTRYYLSRRRLRSIVFTSNFQNKKVKIRNNRRFWVRPGRSDIWWQNLHSSRCTHTHLRAPISVDKQVGITLYYLSGGGRVRKKTANAFGVARAGARTLIGGVHIHIFGLCPTNFF